MRTIFALLNNNIMTSVKQIRAAKPQGKMTMESGNNNITFENGVTFTSETSREKNNLWNKLLKMGFERHYNFSSDEFDGLCQAAQLGENPYKFSIISR